jgi:hypothetical protein
MQSLPKKRIKVAPILISLALALVIYIPFAEGRAERKAKVLCSSTAVGTAATGLLEKALKAGADGTLTRWQKGQSQAESDVLTVMFTGAFPYSRHVCNIEAKNDRVTSASYSHLD